MIYVTSKQNQNNYLIHHGIKGQKWGVRRYQNEDGTLTPAGKKRYGAGVDWLAKSTYRVSKKNPDNSGAGYYEPLMRLDFNDLSTRGLRRFNRDSKDYKEYLKTSTELKVASEDFNRKVYKALKKDGYNIKKLRADYMEKDPDEWTRLYTIGQEYASRIFESDKPYQDLIKRNSEAMARYKSRVDKFLDSLDYESLNLPLSGKYNISVNTKTGESYRTPVKDAIKVAMLESTEHKARRRSDYAING